MMQIIQRRNLQSDSSNRFGQTLHPQAAGDNYAAMSKELLDMTLELKQLKGEELQGLGMNELAKLEKLVETALGRVGKSKNDKLMSEISKLKMREMELIEQNALLKQQSEKPGCTGNGIMDQGSSAESITNSYNLGGRFLDDDRSMSDTSLKLGLPFSGGD